MDATASSWWPGLVVGIIGGLIILLFIVTLLLHFRLPRLHQWLQPLLTRIAPVAKNKEDEQQQHNQQQQTSSNRHPSSSSSVTDSSHLIQQQHHHSSSGSGYPRFVCCLNNNLLLIERLSSRLTLCISALKQESTVSTELVAMPTRREAAGLLPINVISSRCCGGGSGRSSRPSCNHVSTDNNNIPAAASVSIFFFFFLPASISRWRPAANPLRTLVFSSSLWQ